MGMKLRFLLAMVIAAIAFPSYVSAATAGSPTPSIEQADVQSVAPEVQYASVRFLPKISCSVNNKFLACM